MMETVEQLPEWLEENLRKPIAIFGAGVTGRAVREFVDAIGGTGILFDEKGREDARVVFDETAADEVSLVVASPGFPFDHDWFSTARKADLDIVGEFDLAAALWRGPLVTVTGTNGKTTMTEFLEKAFSNAGSEVYAVGNIGRPFCQVLADDCNRESVAICEVSSFQATSLKRFKPDYAIWTNFDEDHLDRHSSMESYFRSKYRLFQLAPRDGVFYDDSVLSFARQYGIDLPPAGYVSIDKSPIELGISGSPFETFPELNTYLMARALWLRMGLGEDELVEAAHSFKKSPHRMELVKTIAGVTFWDDSKATNFHAVFGGLARFTKPVVWIGGGKAKGGDIEGNGVRLASKIASAHLIGQTAEQLRTVLAEQGVCATVYKDLEEATRGAFAQATSGDHVLLSPGFASHDMFDGYSHRGDVFKKTVNSLE